MTPVFTHIFQRASIVDLDGTGIGHYGAMKLVTEYTKELHVERCPRVDLGKLIQAIAGDRWLSYDLDPVHLYTKNRELRGQYDLKTIREPLFEYAWAVVMMSNDCFCKYVKFEEYQPRGDAIPCHACDKDVKSFTMDVSCDGCGSATCKDCQARVCYVSNCIAVYCMGCATEQKCSLCQKDRCLHCRGEWVVHCYGCEANVCDECQPLTLTCSVEQYREYCAQCAGAMEDKSDHWCCDTGEFKIRPTR